MEAATVSALDRKKALGAFYTPADMAQKLVAWAVRKPSDRVLDPSFGGLVFLAQAHERLQALGLDADQAGRQLYGCDLDEDAHQAAAAHNLLQVPDASLLHHDFLAVSPGDGLPCVETVVGNPPYVRYQLHNAGGEAGRAVAAAAGLRLTRLASSWAPFVLHSTSFLVEGGRLALVLPAELLHAQYAKDLLTWVQARFASTRIAVFEQRVFPGALEEVVLLFADGYQQGRSAGPTLISCRTLEDLTPEAIGHVAPMHASTARGGSAKLLAQLLPAATQDLYGRLEGHLGIARLGAIASVDIGAVTGANNFFLLANGEEPQVPPHLLAPAVSKADHVRGARLDEADYERLLDGGTRCRLLVAPADTAATDVEQLGSYLQRGVADGIDQRYKCRTRSPWWSVPLPKGGAPDLLLTYCASEHPRLALNAAGALNTNTLHGVTVEPGTDSAALAAVFYNSLTLLSSELEGRSYGGGVLKLEPTEAEALLVPLPPAVVREHLAEVDEFIRAREVDKALDLIDEVVLVNGLGLTRDEIALLREGAATLRARRRARGAKPDPR